MKKWLLSLIVIGFVFGILPQANALILGFDNAAYLGHIDDGIPPANYEDYLKVLITLPTEGYLDNTAADGQIYDRYGSTLAGPFDMPDEGIKIDGNTGDLDPFVGYQYIMAKYDGPNDGIYVWYFQEGLSDLFTELPTTSPLGYGISNIAGFNNVPEPSTMFLLGAGLLGLVSVRRKKFIKS